MAIARTVQLVADLKGPRGPIGPIGLGFINGLLPQGTNVNTFRTAGLWIIPNATAAESMIGLPVVYPGMLFVEADNASSTILAKQTYTTYAATAANLSGGVWERIAQNTTTFRTWERKPRDFGLVDDNQDLNLLPEGRIGVRAPQDKTIVNGPIDAGPGFVQTFTLSRFDIMRAQLYFEYGGIGGQGRLLYRVSVSFAGTPAVGIYGNWTDLTATSGGGGGVTVSDSGLANSVLQDEFYSRFGGPVGTGGLAAVGIRFDHGLNKFNQHIRPMLESRNLKYCLALASQRWTQAENAEVTAEMVNTWVKGGLAEIWNHGRTAHNNVSGYDANYTYWVTGLEELRTQLPDAFISGVILPGTGTSGQFDGLGGAGNAKQIYSSIGGQVILGHHAVVSGSFPGTEMRPLDGRLRQGQYHFGMESRTATEIIAKVQEAQTQEKGLQLMMHPSLIGEPGYITVADFEQVMSFIAAERDADRLEVLSPYELLIADSAR